MNHVFIIFNASIPHTDTTLSSTTTMFSPERHNLYTTHHHHYHLHNNHLYDPYHRHTYYHLQDCHEFSTLPVRHNEDNLNKELSTHLPIRVTNGSFDSSNTKAFLLLQAYLCDQPLPCTDYNTDTKSVLDQAMRVMQVGFGLLFCYV